MADPTPSPRDPESVPEPSAEPAVPAGASPASTPGETAVSPAPPSPAAPPAARATPAKPAAKPAVKPGRRRRRWPWVVGGLVLTLLLLLLLLPTLLSTSPGTNLVASIASRQVNGTVRIDSLSLGWFSPTRVGGAVVQDGRGVTVIEVGALETNLSVADAIRGRLHLGQTVVRAKLPVVLVNGATGRTNLHDVLGIEETDEPADPFDPADLPSVYGDIALDLFASVQVVNPDGSTSPVVHANLADTRLILETFQRPIRHEVNLALSVGTVDNLAGRLAARGDLLLGDVPIVIDEVATIEQLDLGALSVVMAAVGLSDYRLEGVVNGQLALDSRTGGSGELTIDRFLLEMEGLRQPYTSGQVVVTLDAAPAPGEGADANLIALNQLRIVTDEGPIALSGVINPDALQDLASHWPAAVRQPRVEVQLPFLTVSGGGASLANMELAVTADAAEGLTWAQQFIDLGDLEAEGRLQLDVRTQEDMGRLIATAQGTATNLFLPPPPTADDPQVAAAQMNAPVNQGPVRPGPSPAGANQGPVRPGQASPVAPVPPTPPPPAESAEPAGPLRIPQATFNLSAILVPARGDQPAGIPLATLAATLADTAGRAVAQVGLRAEGVDAGTGSIGRLALQETAVGDYATLREMLGGWAPLPAAEQPMPPLALAGALAWDGAAQQMTIREPVTVSAAGQTAAVLSGGAVTLTPAGEETYLRASDLRLELPSLANLRPVASALGITALEELAGAGDFTLSVDQSAADRMEVALAGAMRGLQMGTVRPGRPGDAELAFNAVLNPAAEDMLAALAGSGVIRVLDVTAEGLTLRGDLPVTMGGGRIAIQNADGTPAQPIAANGGTIDLSGTVLEQRGEAWVLTMPAGRQLVNNVQLNPIVAEALGQYVNFIFVGAEEAGGLLDIRVTEAANLNLADPTGPQGGSLAINFGVRDFRVTNDVLARLADGIVDEARRALVAQGGAIPGFRDLVQREFNVGDEVRQEIRSLSGNIVDAQVRLSNGVAATNLTFNVADPRRQAGQPGQVPVYPLGFSGDVNLQNLSPTLRMTIPRQLIEKWAGESPGDLAQLFGERPFQKLIPDGVALTVGGTTYVPRVDASSVQAAVREVIPRAANAAVRDRAEDAIRRGLRGILN